MVARADTADRIRGQLEDMGVDRSKYEEWKCPNCETKNFPSRKDCRQCGTAKPFTGNSESGGGFSGSGGGYAAGGNDGGGGRDVQAMIDERANARRNRDFGINNPCSCAR